MNEPAIAQLLAQFGLTMSQAEHQAVHLGVAEDMDDVVASATLTGMHTGLMLAVTDPIAARALKAYMDRTIFQGMSAADDELWIQPMIEALR